MPLQPGTTLGPYQVTAKIGEGGMGEVYQARDTRLDRTVAIKVLPEHVASDPDLKQRFEREAKTISSLNHPHICTLYDIGSQDGIDFLVMEYLEGDTLAQRLQKGALPLDQALQVAIEIADALDKVHRQGITHRDLKPGNIMLTKAGAKLLDFGLAKLKPAQQAGGLSALPTQEAPLTEQGTILGTFQYMAPEQLEGQEADARTDIFAFGAVVYEMVTGKRAFEGKSQASLIAAIMHVDPPAPSTLQPISPPVLDHVVGTCLVKDPDGRWQAAGDVGRQLQWVAEGGSTSAVTAPAGGPPARLSWVAWGVAAVTTVVAIVLAVLYLNRAPTDTATTRMSVVAEGVQVSGLALSPDGSQLAFVGGAGRPTQVWVRPRDAVEARALSGTEGAIAAPFWSPDGRSIGFFTQTELRTIDATGGAPQTVSAVAIGNGGTWNNDDVILFSAGGSGLFRGLFQVPAGGGEPSPVATRDAARGDLVHAWPQFLPDGEHVLFTAFRGVGLGDAYVTSLASDEAPVQVLTSALAAQYAAPGYLLFGQGESLMAQPFDVANLAVTGDPTRVAAEVTLSSQILQGNLFSTSQRGDLAYLESSEASALTQLQWRDRSGADLGTEGLPGDYQSPALSPDGTRIAIERAGDLWLRDLTRGTDQRFTFDPAPDVYPIWSPDGARIVFVSAREGRLGLYEKDAAGANPPQLLVESDTAVFPTDWSTDGALVSYTNVTADTSWDLWLLPMLGDRQPTIFLQTPFVESTGMLSPDGRWLAFMSDESGRREVYVQRVPATGGKFPISTGGGRDARWRRDGQELYYLSLDNELMAVDIDAAGDAPTVGIPHVLFQAPFRQSPPQRNSYDVTADGQRFLVNTLVEGALSAPITWVLNWAAELEP